MGTSHSHRKQENHTHNRSRSMPSHLRSKDNQINTNTTTTGNKSIQIFHQTYQSFNNNKGHHKQQINIITTNKNHHLNLQQSNNSKIRLVRQSRSEGNINRVNYDTIKKSSKSKNTHNLNRLQADQLTGVVVQNNPQNQYGLSSQNQFLPSYSTNKNYITKINIGSVDKNVKNYYEQLIMNDKKNQLQPFFQTKPINSQKLLIYKSDKMHQVPQQVAKTMRQQHPNYSRKHLQANQQYFNGVNSSITRSNKYLWGKPIGQNQNQYGGMYR